MSVTTMKLETYTVDGDPGPAFELRDAPLKGGKSGFIFEVWFPGTEGEQGEDETIITMAMSVEDVDRLSYMIQAVLHTSITG